MRCTDVCTHSLARPAPETRPGGDPRLTRPKAALAAEAAAGGVRCAALEARALGGEDHAAALGALPVPRLATLATALAEVAAAALAEVRRRPGELAALLSSHVAPDVRLHWSTLDDTTI